MILNIALLPGDGIGPEITRQAVKVIDAVCNKKGHEPRYREGLIGAVAVEKTGDPYPDKTHKICMSSDSVLFGAIGDPRFDNDPAAKIRPEKGLLDMRQKLGLFANIRPLLTFRPLLHMSPLKREIVEGAGFLTIRELTGGIYFGEPRGRSEDGNTAFDTSVYRRDEIKRIAHLAFDFATKRDNKLTMVDKANVLATSRLWRESIKEMEKEYPRVSVDYMYVDNAAMQIIRSPRDFDVILTENMFGDILTDEAAVISGSLGLIPSASVGDNTSVFEPIHGSYPEAAGKNVANPLAAILSASMMLEYAFGLKQEATIVKKAAEASLKEGVVTKDLDPDMAKGTSHVGDFIASWINRA